MATLTPIQGLQGQMITTPQKPAPLPTSSKYVGVSDTQGDAIVAQVQKQMTPTIPVNTLNQQVPTATVPTAPPPVDSSGVQSITDSTLTKAGQVATQPEPTPAPEKSKAQQLLESFGIKAPGSLEQAYTDITGGITTTPGELAQKKTLATNIQNEITQADKTFRDRVTAIRANPTGQFGGAVEAEVRKAQSEYDNDRANKMIAYNVALGDYTGAKEAVDTLFQLKTKDIENAYQYQKDIGTMAYKLADDEQKAKLDEAKTKADQAFELKKMGINFEYDKKLKNIGLGGTGTSGVLSSSAQAVIDNPNLLNSFTSTKKGQIISELQTNGYDISTLGAKPLSDTAITAIAQDESALRSLEDLKTTIEGKEQFLGPIAGFQRLNPYSEARQLQAKVDLVRQKVGKALEGGVLRKEDEEKYKKILTTLNDTKALSTYKIDNLINTISSNLNNYKALQTGVGKSANITGSLQKKGAVEQVVRPEDLRAKYSY